MTHNYATHYFYQLTSNYGKNWHGSCTYVAWAMLLSYYDTYWRDDYIPEVYDKTVELTNNTMSLAMTSPGILCESRNIALQLKNVSSAEYLEGIEEYISQFFHLKLISMGNNLGFYEDKNKLDSVGIYYDELWELIDYYLYDYIGFSESDIACERVATGVNIDSDDVRAFVVAKLYAGIPVLISMQSEDGSSGHAMVAYDYDSEKDEIYVHTGWSGTKTHVKLSDLAISEKKYTKFVSATALIVKHEHDCTNNYINTDQTATHCSCEFEIHPRYHVYEYTSTSNQYHRYTCIKCGQTGTELHTLPSGDALRKRCRDCNAIVDTTKFPITIYRLKNSALSPDECQ